MRFRLGMASSVEYDRVIETYNLLVNSNTIMDLGDFHGTYGPVPHLPQVSINTKINILDLEWQNIMNFEKLGYGGSWIELEAPPKTAANFSYFNLIVYSLVFNNYTGTCWTKVRRLAMESQ